MIPDETITLTDFHGHLGPYAYLGYRMGKLAMRLLEARGKRMRATVKTGCRPPVSCMIDGIQFSTPCTLGKGNISVSDENLAEAVFEGEKTVTIRLKDSLRKSIDENRAVEGIVHELAGMGDEELFEVR